MRKIKLMEKIIELESENRMLNQTITVLNNKLKEKEDKKPSYFGQRKGEKNNE